MSSRLKIVLVLVRAAMLATSAHAVVERDPGIDIETVMIVLDADGDELDDESLLDPCAQDDEL